jgi:hypothetical protein
MPKTISQISSKVNRFPVFVSVLVCGILFTKSARADMIDAFNLAQFVPLVLESMMNIATSLYKYFVGNGDGLIYVLIYVFLGYYLILYLIKMHLPKDWLSFMGFSGGGEMWSGNTDAWSIVDNVAKPCIRVLIAGLILLQVKPVYVTKWLVNPFLEFGAIYTESVLKSINNSSIAGADAPKCPESVTQEDWISQESCDFLVSPVYIVSRENNKVIKYGLGFMKTGLRGLLTLIPHGGENILNIITGALLVSAFVSANVFMALLIIQAIFDLCLSLIMYPFNVLAWVAKKSDKWFDILPAFNQIIDALKKIVITMIACAFILCINIAVVRALFNWSSSVFEVTAGGAATSNVPTITNSAMSFGQHSLLWISSLLTFFLMQNIFKMTRERLDLYTKDTPQTLYKSVTGDAKTVWDKTKNAPSKAKDMWETGHDIVNKFKK